MNINQTVPDLESGKPAIRRSALKKAFVGNFLDRGWRPAKKLRTNADVAGFLRRAALSDLGGVPVTGPDPKTDEKIARTMAAEVIAAVSRSGGKNAMHWYTDSIERMIGIAGLMHPEVLDDAAAAAMTGTGFKDSDDARTVLYCAMAITSQNIPVSENMGYAVEQYRHFLANGRFDPKGYGVRGSSVKNNLERFNILLDVVDGDIARMRAFLGAEFKMSELRSAAEAVGMSVGATELNDETVHGSMIFGPKIGNGFYQNLSGNYSPVTIDLWFMRTWGRYTGTLTKNSYTESQYDRLAAALAGADDRYRDLFRQSKLDKKLARLSELDNADLLETCNELVLIWERSRRAHVETTGDDNPTVAKIKAALDWPSAAAAISDSLSAPVDAPTSAGQRKWIRSVVRRALEILSENGYEITAATAQALLWYPERSLYEYLIEGKVKNSKNLAYDEALIEIARKEGYSDAEIEDSCLRALEPHGRRGQGGPGRPQRGDLGPVQGIPRQPHRGLGKPGQADTARDGTHGHEGDWEMTEAASSFAI